MEEPVSNYDNLLGRLNRKIAELRASGDHDTEIRCRIEEHIAQIAKDYQSIKAYDKAKSDVEREKLKASVCTTSEERKGFRPAIRSRLTYQLFQKNNMLNADEKGKMRNLWKAGPPCQNPSGSPTASSYKEIAKQIGLPL